MNKKVKKYLLKYSLEFLVIVMGISVSFWLSNYQESVDNAEKEIQVYNDLFNGISSLDMGIKERTFAFKFDSDIIENLLGLSDFNKYNYDDLMTAVTDWRGFGQNQETYSTLKEEGSLKYIVSKELKVKLEKFYGSAANGIISNMEDDVIMQREILNYDKGQKELKGQIKSELDKLNKP